MIINGIAESLRITGSLSMFDRGGGDSSRSNNDAVIDFRIGFAGELMRADSATISGVAAALTAFEDAIDEGWDDGQALEVDFSGEVLTAAIGDQRLTIDLNDPAGFSARLASPEGLAEGEAEEVSEALSELLALDRDGLDNRVEDVAETNALMDLADQALGVMGAEALQDIEDALGVLLEAVGDGESVQVMADESSGRFHFKVGGDQLFVGVKADGLSLSGSGRFEGVGGSGSGGDGGGHDSSSGGGDGSGVGSGMGGIDGREGPTRRLSDIDVTFNGKPAVSNPDLARAAPRTLAGTPVEVVERTPGEYVSAYRAGGALEDDADEVRQTIVEHFRPKVEEGQRVRDGVDADLMAGTLREDGDTETDAVFGRQQAARESLLGQPFTANELSGSDNERVRVLVS